MRRLVLAIAAAGLLLTASFASPARAQLGPTPAPDVPVLISADEMSHDEELGTVTARGNVEIIYGDRILYADAVSYNQKADTVSATGNIVMMEPSGDVMFAEFVELTDEMKNGVVEQIRILLEDDSRFAATGAQRRDGNLTIMRNAVFSPCQLCENNPTRAPLWQLKAREVEHDQAAQEIRYRDATMEMFGVPVFYSPYLQHPDPTVKRRSGFLTPTVGTNDNTGEFVKLPYYIVIDDQSDMTVSPIYTMDEGLIMSGEYRRRFNHASFDMSGSITESNRKEGDPNSPQTKEDRVRGHIKSNALVELNDTWRTGFKVNRATDKSYLRRFSFFPLDNTNALTSNVFAEGFGRRDYAAINAYSFQDLRTGDRREAPLVAPMIELSHVGDANRYGRWSLDGSYRYLNALDRADSQMWSFRPGYQYSWTAPIGLVSSFEAIGFADLYQVDQVDLREPDGLTGRILPMAKTEIRYPFIRESGNVRQLVEPVAAVIVAPNGGNPTSIPEEDSSVFEADDTNLFSIDRFAGLDRVESGPRVVYGLNGGVFGRGEGRTTAFIGQSYRLHTDHELVDNKLVEENKSDYLGRFEVVPNEYVDLVYRFRLSQKDLTMLRNEFSFSAGPSAFRLFGDYIYLDSSTGTGGFEDREELRIGASSRITEFWRVQAFTQRDLTPSGGPLRHALSFRYEDECFVFNTVASRSFTRDADLVPSDSILFQFIFKHLGEINTSAG
ncbi:MAG: LPS-assembly protein LptD [Alphaproteobacteria bacterium]